MKPLVAILALFLATAAVMVGHRAFAQGSPPGQGVYSWVEDGKLRQVWLDPNLIAEFGPAGGQGDPGAGVREAKGLSGSGPVIRFWTLEEQTTQEAGLTMLRTANPVGRFSPVFHFHPAGGGQIGAARERDPFSESRMGFRPSDGLGGGARRSGCFCPELRQEHTARRFPVRPGNARCGQWFEAT